MSTKRIVLNALNFVDARLAGTGVFLRNILAEWLISENPDLTILSSSKIDFVNVFKIGTRDIKWWRIPVHNFIVRICFEQFILPFRLRSFDLYYSPTPAIPLLAKWISPRTKMVVTIHDMIPFFVAGKYGRLRSIYVKFISRYGARVADHVITVSENSKTDICKIAGINPGKVSVVYNFIPNTIPQARDVDGSYFISISTIEPGKNIEKTMEGFSLFMKQADRPDFKFYWMGQIGWGYTQEQLNKLLKNFYLEGKFIFTGFVTDDKKAALISSCTAMVYVSHYEGFGLPVLEALHHFKPAVVSRTSSLPEVVGESGVVCDQNSAADIATAMKKIVDNRGAFQKNIKRQLEKFSKEAQMEKFISIVNHAQ